MPTYRDEAVVLRTHKLGEADRIITLLSRQNGKIRAVARGVRRTSSKFGGRLEPFSHVDVQFATGRALDVVTQVESLHAYGEPLLADYDAYCCGQVMLETADHLVAEEREPALQQYRLLVGALRVLGQGTTDGPRPATMVLDSYLLRALAVAGYAPALDACARCGTEGPHAFFHPSTGGMVCVECRPPGSARPRPETIAYLQALLTGEWSATRDVESPRQREGAGLVQAFVQWHLERGLRSMPYVDRRSPVKDPPAGRPD
ncbi:DNA repair protein RecO [Luteococcus sp. OSA5]|uniref:DNA repair protein RecO n=1 Tax=Luteococcus sp. OSA5 TaxID=3401630 RepID=UPI003B42C248